MSRLPMISWDDLRVVLEVERQGSIYGAAKILKVDHSTVTRRIAHVEILLERQLFDRSNRGIQARPETAALFHHIRQMEIHATAMHEELDRSDHGQIRPIRVATMEGLASGYLAKRVLEINEDERIRLEVFSNPNIVDLLKKEADIFLSFFDPGVPGLVSEKVGETAIYLYGSENYRSKHGFPVSPEDLRHHRYIGYIRELISIESVRWLDDVVPNANIVFCSNSVIAQRNAAISGCGLVVLPTFVGDQESELSRILPDLINTTRPIWMSVGRDQHVLKTINRTAKAIARAFSEDKDFLLGKSALSVTRH